MDAPATPPSKKTDSSKPALNPSAKVFQPSSASSTAEPPPPPPAYEQAAPSSGHQPPTHRLGSTTGGDHLNHPFGPPPLHVAAAPFVPLLMNPSITGHHHHHHHPHGVLQGGGGGGKPTRRGTRGHGQQQQQQQQQQQHNVLGTKSSNAASAPMSSKPGADGINSGAGTMAAATHPALSPQQQKQNRQLAQHLAECLASKDLSSSEPVGFDAASVKTLLSTLEAPFRSIRLGGVDSTKLGDLDDNILVSLQCSLDGHALASVSNTASGMVNAVLKASSATADEPSANAHFPDQLSQFWSHYSLATVNRAANAIQLVKANSPVPSAENTTSDVPPADATNQQQQTHHHPSQPDRAQLMLEAMRVLGCPAPQAESGGEAEAVAAPPPFDGHDELRDQLVAACSGAQGDITAAEWDDAVSFTVHMIYVFARLSHHHHQHHQTQASLNESATVVALGDSSSTTSSEADAAENDRILVLREALLNSPHAKNFAKCCLPMIVLANCYQSTLEGLGERLTSYEKNTEFMAKLSRALSFGTQGKDGKDVASSPSAATATDTTTQEEDQVAAEPAPASATPPKSPTPQPQSSPSTISVQARQYMSALFLSVKAKQMLSSGLGHIFGAFLTIQTKRPSAKELLSRAAGLLESLVQPSAPQEKGENEEENGETQQQPASENTNNSNNNILSCLLAEVLCAYQFLEKSGRFHSLTVSATQSPAQSLNGSLDEKKDTTQNDAPAAAASSNKQQHSNNNKNGILHALLRDHIVVTYHVESALTNKKAVKQQQQQPQQQNNKGATPPKISGDPLAPNLISVRPPNAPSDAPPTDPAASQAAAAAYAHQRHPYALPPLVPDRPLDSQRSSSGGGVGANTQLDVEGGGGTTTGSSTLPTVNETLWKEQQSLVLNNLCDNSMLLSFALTALSEMESVSLPTVKKCTNALESACDSDTEPTVALLTKGRTIRPAHDLVDVAFRLLDPADSRHRRSIRKASDAVGQREHLPTLAAVQQASAAMSHQHHHHHHSAASLQQHMGGFMLPTGAPGTGTGGPSQRRAPPPKKVVSPTSSSEQHESKLFGSAYGGGSSHRDPLIRSGGGITHHRNPDDDFDVDALLSQARAATAGDHGDTDIDSSPNNNNHNAMGGSSTSGPTLSFEADAALGFGIGHNHHNHNSFVSASSRNPTPLTGGGGGIGGAGDDPSASASSSSPDNSNSNNNPFSFRISQQHQSNNSEEGGGSPAKKNGEMNTSAASSSEVVGVGALGGGPPVTTTGRSPTNNNDPAVLNTAAATWTMPWTQPGANNNNNMDDVAW